MERLSSDLSSLAFEQKQERLEWRRAMEVHSAEIQQLLERQDAMQVRQDELETLAIEIEEQAQQSARELAARLQALSERLDRLEAGHDRQETDLAELRGEVAGLGATTDVVFDDIADRVGVFDRTLTEFDLTLSKQYEVLTESLQEARDQLTEGLAEAQEAAEGHADGIVELKDAIATYQERREELDADAREQLAAMQDQLAEARAGIASALESLREELQTRLEAHGGSLQEFEAQLSARLARQEEETRSLVQALRETREQAGRELEELGQLASQLAAQGQMFTQALESVQQGSMKAEEQLGAAMTEQFGTLLRQLEQANGAWQANLGQTQHHLREFEVKVAKALGLQRNENLEHERQLTSLRDDLAILTNRVGTIVQLLTKASQPARSAFDPSAT